MSRFYELILFTASLQKAIIIQYADSVLKFIDTKKLFKQKFYRENCIIFNGQYVKDLTVINKNLKNIILLDVSLIRIPSHLFISSLLMEFQLNHG